MRKESNRTVLRPDPEALYRRGIFATDRVVSDIGDEESQRVGSQA